MHACAHVGTRATPLALDAGPPAAAPRAQPPREELPQEVQRTSVLCPWVVVAKVDWLHGRVAVGSGGPHGVARRPSPGV